jgi:hypothetical protein
VNTRSKWYSSGNELLRQRVNGLGIWPGKVGLKVGRRLSLTKPSSLEQVGEPSSPSSRMLRGRVIFICAVFQRRFSPPLGLVRVGVVVADPSLLYNEARGRLFPQPLKHTGMMDGSSYHKPAKHSTSIARGPGIPAIVFDLC